MTADRLVSSPWSRAAVAAALYLGLALWVMRSVLPAPASLLPYRASLTDAAVRALDHSDQLGVVWTIAQNARAFATGSPALLRVGQCYPLERALTLGDHMLGVGLLGALPYRLTHDPILTFNVVVGLTLWIAALSMYALAHYWTGSATAAFVAGFLFGFDPWRITDCSHPSVHGNLWTPLVLLFMHRLFARRRWIDAAGLAGALGLQALESFYQLIPCALLGGVYGLTLAVRHRRTLVALLPKLAAVAAVVAGVGAAVLGPYLQTRATWNLLAGRPLQLFRLTDFGIGGAAYPGTAVLLLAAVGMLDRLRGPRRADDPRLAYLAGGLLVLWCVVSDARLPLVGVALPSPLALARQLIPGIGAVRALGTVRFGVNLVAAFLAAYGVLAVIAARRGLARRAAEALVVAAAVADVLWLPLARRSFAEPAVLVAYLARPPAPVIQTCRRVPEGAVLNLPFHFDLRGDLLLMPFYVLLGAYHQQPMAACYNSFPSPLGPDVEALANRLPDPAAADALYALGFRTLLVHTGLLTTAERAALDLAQPALAGRVHLEEETGSLQRYRLTTPLAVQADLTALAGGTMPAGQTAELAPPEGTVRFAFRNASGAIFRHPAPIEPSALVARWRRPAGETVAEDAITALLPLALAPGETMVRPIALRVPSAAGDYTVSLALAAAPHTVLAAEAVRVVAGPATRQPADRRDPPTPLSPPPAPAAPAPDARPAGPSTPSGGSP